MLGEGLADAEEHLRRELEVLGLELLGRLADQVADGLDADALELVVGRHADLELLDRDVPDRRLEVGAVDTDILEDLGVREDRAQHGVHAGLVLIREIAGVDDDVGDALVAVGLDHRRRVAGPVDHRVDVARHGRRGRILRPARAELGDVDVDEADRPVAHEELELAEEVAGVLADAEQDDDLAVVGHETSASLRRSVWTGVFTA